MALLGFKSGTVIGLGVGYVLGTRAGRERYLEILDWWTKLRGDERVGTAVDKVVAVVSGPAQQVREIVGNGLRSASDSLDPDTR